MQDDAANKLHIVVALAQTALGSFPHHGKGFHQEVVKGLALM